MTLDDRDELVEKMELLRDSHKRNKPVKQPNSQSDDPPLKRLRNGTSKQSQSNPIEAKKNTDQVWTAYLIAF